MKIFKKCNKCSTYKHKDQFAKNRRQCKACRTAITKIWYHKTHTSRCWSCNERKFSKDFKKFARICSQCLQHKAIEKEKARVRINKIGYRKQLAAPYIKGLIKGTIGLKYDQITDEMIEGYRNVIKIKREVAKLNKKR